jgi:hypothetical protein
VAWLCYPCWLTVNIFTALVEQYFCISFVYLFVYNKHFWAGPLERAKWVKHRQAHNSNESIGLIRCPLPHWDVQGQSTRVCRLCKHIVSLGLGIKCDAPKVHRQIFKLSLEQ